MLTGKQDRRCRCLVLAGVLWWRWWVGGGGVFVVMAMAMLVVELKWGSIDLLWLTSAPALTVLVDCTHALLPKHHYRHWHWILVVQPAAEPATAPPPWTLPFTWQAASYSSCFRFALG